MQGYDPAAHILRRGFNKSSTFTSIMLGGSRAADDDVMQLLHTVSRFLSNNVAGPGVRFEAVVSGNTSSDVLSLMETYGSRMLEMCLLEGLLVKSSKNWPFYVNDRLATRVRRLQDVLNEARTHFNRKVSRLCLFLVGFYGFLFLFIDYRNKLNGGLI